jgi:putative membrane protein
MTEFLVSLTPWHFAPSVAASVVLAVGFYVLGIARGGYPGFWRVLGFVLGIALMYAVSHTQLDYYGQYLFSGHRAQHLVLHHLGPFLVALSAPAPVFAAALPSRWTGRLRRSLGPVPRVVLAVYRVLQNPFIAAFLFVGLLYFWLWPTVHFTAMLSADLYWIMNWSMALDGLLFWWLVFARDRDGATPHLSFGKRVLMLAMVVPPQIVLGAYIFFSDRNLFDVYAVCGRAFPIDPMTDQQIGGLITWIPASMMSVAGVIILLAFRLRELRREELGQTVARVRMMEAH